MQSSSSPSETAVSRKGLMLRPWEGLILGLAAAAVVCGMIQAVHPVFRVPKEFDVPSIGLPTEKFLAHRREQDRVDSKHAALYVGGLGFLLAAALAVREAAARRSWLPPIVAPPLGAAGGALGGMLGSQVLQYVRVNIGQADLMHMVGAQLAVAVPLGLGVGLGLGLATRTAGGIVKTALAGVAAGTLAAVVVPVAVSLLLPAANTDALLPEEASTRLLWLGLLSGLIGLVIPIAGRRRTAANAKLSPAKL